MPIWDNDNPGRYQPFFGTGSGPGGSHRREGCGWIIFLVVLALIILAAVAYMGTGR